ncbi:N-acetylmuramoyl-L-alanine amidase [Sporosarcina sp. P34]|uniref:N-acetylmuramoyl-L-alanine amidase family protein n=1 Tax=Sporosarcina sp. P34 TaxID=2048247 RepID=UPI001304021F|nr:N-acetylmuramoyl-L-alanine amidase [Sporosarcina sp. P34]
MSKIFIDPGHGGHDPGAVGNRSREKDNVLKVALRLKTILEGYGHEVRLSRSTDVFIPLGERARLANAWGADYYFSLHDNSATATATGFETFVYNGSVSAATTKIQNAVHSSIANQIGIRDRGKKRANFAVLRLTHMPAVLVEYAFISNYSDETILIDEVEKLALLTAQGIVNYAGGKKDVAAVPNKPTPKPVAKTEKLTIELEFTSGTLRKVVETFLGSKLQQEIAVNAASERGYSSSWVNKQTDGAAANGDLVALMIGAGVKEFK